MKTIAATFAMMLVTGAAGPTVGTLYAADDTLVASIEKQGGHVVRDAKGNIVEVSLARTWATDADVEKIAGIKTLKKLDLSLTYVSDVGAEAIATLTQLEELNLFTAEFITDAAVAFLRGNTNLRVLNLRGTDITDTSLEYVSQLGNLRSLDISFTQIGDVGMEHLAPLSQLEELNVGGTKISGAALHVLKYLPSLKRLSFYGTQRRNAGVCWAPVMTDSELDTIALLGGSRRVEHRRRRCARGAEAGGAWPGDGRSRVPHHGRHAHYRFRHRQARESQEASLPESERLCCDRRRAEDTGRASESSAPQPVERRRYE